jgi:hypothetical protein
MTEDHSLMPLVSILAGGILALMLLLIPIVILVF